MHVGDSHLSTVFVRIAARLHQADARCQSPLAFYRSEDGEIHHVEKNAKVPDKSGLFNTCANWSF